MRVELNRKLAKLQAEAKARDSKTPSESRASLLQQLGTLFATAGRNDEALVVVKEALGIVDKARLNGSPVDAQLRLDLADRVFEAQHYDEALSLYRTATATIERTHGISSRIYWRARERFGLSAGAIGNYELARREVFTVLAYRQNQAEENSENTGDLISIYLSIARIEGVAGRVDRVHSVIKEAHNRALFLGDDSVMADVFHEMGKMHASQGDLDNGLDYLEGAYRLRCGCLGSKHPTTLLSKLGVAALLIALGRLEEARASLILVRNNAAHDPYNPVNWDSCMAELLLRKGKPQKALRYYRRTLERADLLSHAQRVTMGHGAVLVAIKAGDLTKAVKYAHAALKVAVECWENVLGHGSELDRLGWMISTDVVSMCAAVAAYDSTPLTKVILRFKAAVADSVAEDVRFIANSELAQKIEGARQALRKVELDTTSSDEGFSSARTELDRMESMRAAERARSRKLFNAASIGALRSAVGTNRILVEYVRFNRRDADHRYREWLGALVISKDCPPAWVDLGPTEGSGGVFTKLAAFVLLLRSRTLPSDSEFRDAGLALHDAVWLPVSKMFGNAMEEVVVSPDGFLHQLSFAALWSGACFLGEGIRFRYVTSGRRLLNHFPKEPELGTGVIVVSPDFDRGATAGCATDSAQRLSSQVIDWLRLRGDGNLPEAYPPLPGTRNEGDRVALLWRKNGIAKVKVFQGRKATKSNLTGIRRPQFLHIATHGQLHIVGKGFSENQLLHPWLALSGANRTLSRIRDGKKPATPDDGLLRADEIRSLDLAGTQLVVLSACDSGMGSSIALEGAYSFRRAFQEAGARFLLQALWTVNDVRTAEFMPQFYQGVFQGRDPVRALHEVQSEALESSRRASGPALAARLYGGFVMSA